MTDEAELDKMFDTIDDMLLAGNFDMCDNLMSMHVENHDVNMLMTILTATLPAKSKLPSRSIFKDRVETMLRKTGQYEDGLLAGL